MGKNDAVTHVADLVSRAPSTQLNMKRETWKRINPKYSMIARAFISLLQDEVVLGRLERAQSIEEMKALLVVDDYLSKVKHVESKRQIQELLENPDASLEVIQAFAALSHVKDALVQAGAKSEAERLIYTAEGAAKHLGWHTEEVHEAIRRGDINAELCVRLTELLRVRKHADAVRQARSNDPSAQRTGGS